MGLCFRAVLCGLCGSSIVGVAGGCGSSLGLFCDDVVGGALSLALLCALVNPRRACAARVTVVVLCVCMYVCMCVCPLIPAASHIGITKERYQRILRNTGIVLNFADFPKNALFKSYGVICLPRAAPAS